MPDVISASTGPYALGPYGDEAEHTGPPQVITLPDVFRPFFATDARSVMVTLLPQHYNFIPNPAFRTDASGWEFSGSLNPGANAHSWTFVGTTSASTNYGRLSAIRNGTTAAVEPDPAASPPKQDGQIVYISDTEVWLVVDSGSTLTVADAASVGLPISLDTDGFRLWTAQDSLDSDDSWVGQSLLCSGEGSLRYRSAADQFVYVGPLNGTEENQWDPRRGGSEYTFSAYFKGAGEVRLRMDAYYPEDFTDLTSGPEYQSLTMAEDPTVEAAGDPAILGPEGRVWTLIDPTPAAAPYYEDIGRPPAFEDVIGGWQQIEDDGEWHRISLKTRARVEPGEGLISFVGARWIDTRIEIRSAKDLRVSAVMLDSTEYPECAYFDGGMTEDVDVDDFLWEDEADASVSYYYFDRVVRTKWLCQRMSSVVPVARPFQIFFGSYWRPFVCKTGETIVMEIPPPT
jgi:hypothetical protein